jgi:bifunctional non-homologous end joining protein LigD
VKTTGGGGLHVVAPIKRHRQWDECLAFSRRVAEALARADPATFTTTFAKKGRESKILIDYLRNNRTNTSIAAFSTRVRTGATVSMPIKWSELTPRLRPASFTAITVVPRLSRLHADPWSDYWICQQRITAAALTALDRL